MGSGIADAFALLANDPRSWLTPVLPDGEALLPLALVAAAVLSGLLPAIARSGHRVAAPDASR